MLRLCGVLTIHFHRGREDVVVENSYFLFGTDEISGPATSNMRTKMSGRAWSGAYLQLQTASTPQENTSRMRWVFLSTLLHSVLSSAFCLHAKHHLSKKQYSVLMLIHGQYTFEIS